MIACPRCGSDTRVIETRDTIAGYQRRRRACTVVACNERMSTIEMIVDDTRVIEHDPLLIRRQDLERILASAVEPLIATLGLSYVTRLLENSHGQKTSTKESRTGRAAEADVQRSAEVEDLEPVREPIDRQQRSTKR